MKDDNIVKNKKYLVKDYQYIGKISTFVAIFQRKF